jgi:hypothetical protein
MRQTRNGCHVEQGDMTDIERAMAACTEELRVKLPAEDHAFLNAVALASRDDMQSIVRRLIHEFLEAERHKATVLARFLHSEGIAAKSRGSEGA